MKNQAYLTIAGCPVAPRTWGSLITEAPYPDRVIDTLERQSRGPRPRVFIEVSGQYAHVFLEQQTYMRC